MNPLRCPSAVDGRRCQRLRWHPVAETARLERGLDQ